MKYLPLYEEWMKKGELPDDGLCNSIPKENGLLPLFEPLEAEGDELIMQGLSRIFWGSGLQAIAPFGASVYSYMRAKYKGFTPLRQTIVLFMAAMNGEL